MHGVLRPSVSRFQSTGFGIDVVAVQAHQRPFLGGKADLIQVVLIDAEVVELTHGVGLQAGSFGSLSPDGLDGCQSVFGEVLDAFDHLEAEPSYECERGVAASCEHLRGMPGVSAGVVFTTGDVANVMKAVLDAPMRA
jgi:hypothetical protein